MRINGEGMKGNEGMNGWMHALKLGFNYGLGKLSKASITASLVFTLGCFDDNVKIPITDGEPFNITLSRNFKRIFSDSAKKDGLTIDFSNEYIQTLINQLTKNYAHKYENDYNNLLSKSETTLTIPKRIIYPDIAKVRSKIREAYLEDLTYKIALYEAVTHDPEAEQWIIKSREANPLSYPPVASIKGQNIKQLQQQQGACQKAIEVAKIGLKGYTRRIDSTNRARDSLRADTLPRG